MNRILNIGLVVCAICAGLTSCNKDPEYFELPTYPDEMKVKSSIEEIVLQESMANDVALVLSWNKATSPISPNDKVTYKVCFYPSQAKDKKSKYIETEETQLSLTHNELNSMVARWALPGEPIKVTAQVLSIVENETKYVKPEVSTVEIVMTGWEKYPQYIYMIMTKDDESVATERLEQRELGTGVYEATFEIEPCTFHFVTNAAEPYPVYSMDPEGDGEQMEFVVQGEYTEFESYLLGKRTVIVDVNGDYNDCRIVEMVDIPTPFHIWIVGDGCSVGWNPNSPAGRFEMVDNVREPWWYEWTGDFYEPKEATDTESATEGMFKIGLEDVNGYDCLFFFAPKSGTDPAQDNTLIAPRKGGADDKWLVTKESAGTHTIRLCLLANDLHFDFE